MAAKAESRKEAAPAKRKRPRLTAVPAAAVTAGDDAKFDRLIYERVRLGIMSALAVREELTFMELKALFEVSDGNLTTTATKSVAVDRGPKVLPWQLPGQPFGATIAGLRARCELGWECRRQPGAIQHRRHDV